MTSCEEMIEQLRAAANPERKQGMARAGINVSQALGVRIPDIRRIAKSIGKNHLLAEQLWETGIHEARLLAGMIDDYKAVTDAQMENWVRDFASWDVTDQCLNNLFWKTPSAFEKAVEWSRQDPEFVKRAGFVMMAALAVHAKRVDDAVFTAFFPHIEAASGDPRNFVKKAVNWALRQIGKRNLALHAHAIETAKGIQRQESATARWIAADALREFANGKIVARLRTKKS